MRASSKVVGRPEKVDAIAAVLKSSTPKKKIKQFGVHGIIPSRF